MTKHTYKQTEIGLIPSDWKVTKLKKVVTLINGKAYKQEELLLSGKYKVLRVGNFFSNNSWYYSDLELEENKYVLNGDLMYAWSASFGPRFWNEEKTVYHYHIWKVITSDKIDKTFLFHLFEFHKEQILNQSQGGTMFHITKGDMEARFLPLPPTLAEQTAIATALSDTDALISSLSSLITKKRNIKQGAMQKLLQPKEGWEIRTYGETFDFLVTATYSRAELTENDEIAYVHYGDIHTKWNSFLDFSKNNLPTIPKEQLKNYPFIKEGDIIMADASEDYLGVGESIEIKNIGNKKAIAGLHTFLLRDRKSVFFNGFKGYLHKSKIIKSQIERLASGLKVYGISKYNLKNVKIPIPPFEEQTRIATILSDMDAQIASLEQQLAKYKHIKQGMMQNLLTGKIRLHQDLQDSKINKIKTETI